MELLIRSKVSLLAALEMISKMISFHPLSYALQNIKKEIIKGNSLHICMEKYNIFEPRAVSLVMVGEEVNQLDLIFNKLNLQYSEELEYHISLLNRLLEPLLIIIVGGLIAIILIAMYLPMFQMGTSLF